MFNVPEIDQQHQELVNKLNSLTYAVKSNQPREEIYRIIDEVISITRLHFTSEEQLMVQSGYPEIEAHKNKHKELISEALHLKNKLDHVGENLFTDWFNHWPFARVVAHIEYADKQIEDHIARGSAKK